ncbi:ABC transporter ATP-binding protein [soil metagenome]|jgi:ABC-type multidrug transport system fused ATPase/permease subunit
MRTLPYADPGVPDLRGPHHYLWWVARGQWRTLVLGTVLGTVWMLSQAMVPAVVGSAIDDGLIGGDRGALLTWSLAVVGLALLTAASGTLRHRFAVANWLQAAFRTIQLVGDHAARTGPALGRAVPTGEVVTNVASDSMRIGGVYDVFGRFVGAIVSYAVVAAILLSRNLTLGLVVLIGVPLLVTSLGSVLRPLQRRQTAQREESGRLTTLGADTVTGLRVLRGIGGEETFLRRYAEQSQRVLATGRRVAPVQATLDSARVLLPGIFMVLVTWIGARLVAQDALQPGDLVAFYGYAMFLVLPLSTATEFADRFIRARIAAGKTIAILRVPGDEATTRTGRTAPAPDRAAELHDPVSGVRIEPGRMTCVVSARAEEAAAVADRLGRFGPEPTPVTWGGVELSEIDLGVVRERIVLVENDSHLFTGPLREGLDIRGTRSDSEILEAVRTASAQDVLQALPEGLDSEMAERGRSFSGGQRQRLVLVRALLIDPEVLVLVEPTSAVDAHTEARIAARLAVTRTGRTTVVMSASPLVLDQADEVLLLVDGTVVARGRHHDLMSEHPAYRSVVVRGEEVSV